MLYHYYKPRGPDECQMYIQNESGRRGNHHRFITEKQVFARWAKQYNITFTNPNWWEQPRQLSAQKSLNKYKQGGGHGHVHKWDSINERRRFSRPVMQVKMHLGNFNIGPNDLDDVWECFLLQTSKAAQCWGLSNMYKPHWLVGAVSQGFLYIGKKRRI